MDVVKATRVGHGRKRLGKRGSKRLFSKTASRTRKENVMSNPMRGGIRL